MDPNGNKLVQELVEKVKSNLNEDGKLMPTFFVHGERPKDFKLDEGEEDGWEDKGALYILGMEIEDGMKQKLAEAMRDFAKSKNADWTMFVTECYMKGYDKDEEPVNDGTPVRDMPGRIEAVMFSFEGPDGDYMALAPIRFKADKPCLLEVKFEKNEQPGEGTFSNLLGKRVA